jgi:hypothetical protein
MLFTEPGKKFSQHSNWGRTPGGNRSELALAPPAQATLDAFVVRRIHRKPSRFKPFAGESGAMEITRGPRGASGYNTTIKRKAVAK